jgi:hypothetical protein
MNNPRVTHLAGPFITEEGMTGLFTREQAPGAIPNGTRIMKANSEPEDATRDGELGTVLGSIAATPEMVRQARAKGYPAHQPDPQCAYFVEWDHKPKFAVGVTDYRITTAPNGS